MEMYYPAVVVGQDDQYIQHSERGGGHHEEVHGCHASNVVDKKGSPSWLRWPWCLGPILADGCIRDLDSQVGQLIPNADTAPGWIGLPRAADQMDQLRIN